MKQAFHKFYQSEVYDRFTCLSVREILDISEDDLVDELVDEYKFE